MHDSIISLKGDAWAHKPSLILPPFTEMPVQSQENVNVHWILEMFCECCCLSDSISPVLSPAFKAYVVINFTHIYFNAAFKY